MAMKKLINRPEDIAKELINGLVNSHPDLLRLAENDIVLRARPKEQGKVWIVFGQGIGHEPAFDGLLGYGLHDVEVPGGIFACAGAEKIYQGIKLAWEFSGHTPVLELVANHEGDVLNAGMAVEMARAEDIDVEPVILYDDIASAPKGQEQKRRGMAGQLFSFKVAGAMAEAGKPRDEIIRRVKEVNNSTRTLAVALRPCTIPTTGQLLFHLEEDEIIIGPGVHDEAGPEGPIKLPSANAVMDIVAERVIADGGYSSGDEVLVIINGSGSTALMELFILYNRLEQILKSRKLKVHRPLIGNYVTTQEMAGFSLSMCTADEETRRYWDSRLVTPYWKVTGD
jgi:dihydroxyacetone kinase-like protein